MGNKKVQPQPSALTRINTQHLELGVTDRSLPKHIVNGFGRYERFNKFAEGGTALLEECLDKNLGRVVVMKRLHAHMAEDETEQKRFLREARVTALIQHPATVPVYEIGRDRAGSVYFTMKKVEGVDLREILLGIIARDPAFKNKYTQKDLVEVLVQVGQAVAFAHSRGVVHRDLKPANILVGEFGEVMVLDWGLAKVLNEPESVHGDIPDQDHLSLELTRGGKRAGTPLYMSPEQAAGDNDKIDGRCDVYSLGSILYEILTHENLVWGIDKDEVLERIQTQDAVPPRKRTPQRKIPRVLDSICMRAIQRKPENRYESLMDMVDDLKAYLLHEKVTAHHYNFKERFINWEKRNNLLSVSIGSAILGALAWSIIQKLI
ncbi:serine/threonine-protein kinase [Kiritimatiellaeota bacterium B1221]|nr:serine/threonine-protein kinase [Kiritimatiellaeota bacterium B1221]